MPITLAKYLGDKLTEAGWPGVLVDDDKQSIKVTGGDILNRE